MSLISNKRDFLVPEGDGAFAYDLDVYRTLLESTLAIPWKIEWATMRFAYIGPQIEPLLGWSQESWQTVEDWASRIHPDDRERVVNFCVSQSMAGIDHEADYRALAKDGSYVWIRDVVHVVRKPDGEVDCLVGFMFDITERKKIETELLEMQKKLEALSYEDGLTGVANRRLFDADLEKAWKNARRSGQPVSLLLIDVDHFKQFNDHYGHLRGDDCLIKVARALREVARHPPNLFARYGGEEFVMLLPETGLEAAAQLAERCREVIDALAIPHERVRNGHLTVSIGVGSKVPDGKSGVRALVGAVDKLLYKAKHQGRDQVVAAEV